MSTILDKTFGNLFCWTTNSTVTVLHQQLSLPSPYQCCSASEKRPANCSTFKATLSEGGRGVKVYHFPDCVFLQGDWNLCHSVCTCSYKIHVDLYFSIEWLFFLSLIFIGEKSNWQTLDWQDYMKQMRGLCINWFFVA